VAPYKSALLKQFKQYRTRTGIGFVKRIKKNSCGKFIHIQKGDTGPENQFMIMLR